VAPQARFQSAGEMKQKLEAAMANLGSSAGSAELAAFVHRALEPGDSAPAEKAPGAPSLPAPAASSPVPVSWPPEPAFAPAMPAPPAGPVAAELPPEMAAPEMGALIEPVAAVGAVAMGEEGGRKSRTFLYVAIAALVVVAIATFWFLNRRRGETPPAASPPATGSATQTPGAAPAGSPAPAGTPQAAATPGGVNVQALVDKQLAQKEEDLRKSFEQKQKEMEAKIAAAKATGKPVPTPAAGVPPPATPAQAVRSPAPEPAAPSAASAPEPQREPEPAKTQEKVAEKAPPPAPEPPRPRTPEPAAAPRVKAGDLVEPGPGVSPPQLVNFSKPAYPPLARSLRVEGDVVISVLVDENGQVQDARVTESVNQKVGINEAALSAARSARYKPATKEGVRVKMWTRLRIPFKL
jgi:protein TonB